MAFHEASIGRTLNSPGATGSSDRVRKGLTNMRHHTGKAGNGWPAAKMK
jgi:hypothetical protein